MKSSSSRRDFIAAGLALPVAGVGATTSGLLPGAPGLALSPSRPAAGGITYRTLGKTGLKVSSVGYGCMITSDGSVISRAVDMGITYFDSSRWYQKGNNERMVGAALGANRNKIILSTKVDAEDTKGALEELETSLKELRTDHLDIWYLHGKDSPEDISDELLEAVRIAKQQGKARFTGVSTHRPAAIAAKVLATKEMEVVLSQYNFTSDEAAGKALQSFHDADLGVVAMKVMAGGFRRRQDDKDSPTQAILRNDGAMLAALKWVLKNPIIGTTIPSMTDIDQLQENFRAMSEEFSSADEKVLSAQLEMIRPLYCQNCGQCDGVCVKGLPVSAMVRFVSYAEGYGQFALGRERFLELPTELQNVRCSNCSSCSIQCPNGVNVVRRVSRAQELFA